MQLANPEIFKQFVQIKDHQTVTIIPIITAHSDSVSAPNKEVIQP